MEKLIGSIIAGLIVTAWVVAALVGPVMALAGRR